MANELNPLGILAIDHLEFTTQSLQGPIHQLFRTFGLTLTYKHSDIPSQLYSQGKINFLLTADPNPTSHAHQYYLKHGDGVSKMSFLVEDAEYALKTAVKRGGTLVEDLMVEKTSEGVIKRGCIQGFGDVLNEFISRESSNASPLDHHDLFFKKGYVKVSDDKEKKSLKTPLHRIDHLTNNVPKGEMEKWVEFYQKVYGFQVTRYFDIRGKKTGLFSKVVQLNNGEVIIPINEPEADQGKSQIQEFLDRHKGPGVQHIALTTGNILSTIAELQERKIKFLSVPHTYYEDIKKRNLIVEEDLKILEDRQLLVDGDEKGYLLQIFSDTYIGPSFFEFIQRKNHYGFGEGNFQALFDAIERDQIQRGYL